MNELEKCVKYLRFSFRAWSTYFYRQNRNSYSKEVSWKMVDTFDVISSAYKLNIHNFVRSTSPKGALLIEFLLSLQACGDYWGAWGCSLMRCQRSAAETSRTFMDRPITTWSSGRGGRRAGWGVSVNSLTTWDHVEGPRVVKKAQKIIRSNWTVP